jgi:uncharacterized membrane protein
MNLALGLAIADRGVSGAMPPAGVSYSVAKYYPVTEAIRGRFGLPTVSVGHGASKVLSSGLRPPFDAALMDATMLRDPRLALRSFVDDDLHTVNYSAMVEAGLISPEVASRCLSHVCQMADSILGEGLERTLIKSNKYTDRMPLAAGCLISGVIVTLVAIINPFGIRLTTFNITSLMFYLGVGGTIVSLVWGAILKHYADLIDDELRNASTALAAVEQSRALYAGGGGRLRL